MATKYSALSELVELLTCKSFTKIMNYPADETIPVKKWFQAFEQNEQMRKCVIKKQDNLSSYNISADQLNVRTRYKETGKKIVLSLDYSLRKTSEQCPVIMKIILDDNFKHFRHSSTRLPIKKREVVGNKVQEWLQYEVSLMATYSAHKYTTPKTGSTVVIFIFVLFAIRPTASSYALIQCVVVRLKTNVNFNAWEADLEHVIPLKTSEFLIEFISKVINKNIRSIYTLILQKFGKTLNSLKHLAHTSRIKRILESPLESAVLAYNAKDKLFFKWGHKNHFILVSKGCVDTIGAQLLLSSIRQHLWPIKAKSMTRPIVRNTVRCNEANPKLSL
ncbi:hypothetical protein GQX74_009479 [Glossina fuscipes]|nr:hypothetical protein GQX74_009479 [Glossina fuscipes]